MGPRVPEAGPGAGCQQEDRRERGLGATWRDPRSPPGPQPLAGEEGRLVLRAASHGETGTGARASQMRLKGGEKRKGSGAMRHKLEAGVGLAAAAAAAFFPPGEVSFVQIARPCQLGRDLTRETWSLPRFSCERMPLLFLSKE